MTSRPLILLFLAVVAGTSSPSCFAQSREQNTRALSKYLKPYHVTQLEWELTQFNILWQGSFTAVDYVTSFPVFFDAKAARFRTSFRVHERRDYQDPKPFFSLSRPERESILRAPVDHLLELLGQSFPEIKSNPSLVFIEFKFMRAGGGSSNVAVYENGHLVLAE